jgi:hypothetical protein
MKIQERIRELNAEARRCITYLRQRKRDPVIPPLDCPERLAYCRSQARKLKTTKP